VNLYTKKSTKFTLIALVIMIIFHGHMMANAARLPPIPKKPIITKQENIEQPSNSVAEEKMKNKHNPKR